ncbi:MAG: PAS domain S-box protein [Candidatus Cloacimonetes bacterium]|nr:PAS domain S-box protein [Candidatus Cloacimonadota bacterium]
MVKILVTDDNPPYEFRDHSGNLTGINIDLIRETFSQLGVAVTLTTDDRIKSDLLSSFATHDKDEKLLESRTIYRIKLFSYTKAGTKNTNSIERVYIVNQRFLQSFVNNYNSALQINLFRTSEETMSSFMADSNGLLVIDNFYLKALKEEISKNRLNISDISEEIDFRLIFNESDPVLFDLVSKGIYEAEFNNKVVEIFDKWNTQVNKFQNIYFQINEHAVIYVFISFILLCFIIILMIKSRIIRRDLLEADKEKEIQIDRLNKIIDSLNNSLILAETKNKNVLENINSIALSLDMDGKILYVNNMINAILGYNPEWLVGSHITKILPENEAKKLLMVFRTVSEQDKYSSNEIVIMTKEGLKKIFIFTALLNKGETGVHTINCILQDITERKSLETRLESYANHLEELVRQRTQRLKDSEERFRMLVEKSYDGIFLYDEQQFIFINPSFSAMSGYSLDELQEQNMTLNKFIDQESQTIFMNRFNQYKDEKLKFFAQELRFKNRYSMKIDVEINLSRIIFNGREVELGLIRDITEKKRSETERLEQERLMVVSQLAITANDRINSPLNAINGYTELLEMQIKNKTTAQENAFTNIYKSTQIIETIMRKLKSLASIKLKDYKLKDLQMFDLDDKFPDKIDNLEGKTNE